MAGPTNQTTVQLTIPPGEAEVQYSATLLAQKVENLELTPEDTLISTLGLAPYDLTAPWRSFLRVAVQDPVTGILSFPDFVPQPPLSVFHKVLQRGASPMLIARFGGTLWRYMGGGTSNSGGPWYALAGSLSTDDQPRFPDQYVVMNDKIIWTNGVDQPRVISYNNMVTPLGYSDTPTPPTVFCPTQPLKNEVPRHLPNTIGYSWPVIVTGKHH